MHDIPPFPKASSRRGISADDSIDWWLDIAFDESPAETIEKAESAFAVLHSIGDEAPKIRTPPEILGEIDEQEREFALAKEAYARIPQEVFPYEASSYDSATGTFSAGVGADGKDVRMELHTPGKGTRHFVVAGMPGIGKTNHLNVVNIEALQSCRFVLMHADPGCSHDIEKTWANATKYLAPDYESSLALLMMAAAMVAARIDAGGYTDPSFELPGILLTIEDAHLLFSTSIEALESAELIAEFGPAVCVSLAISLPDGNIQRFGGSERLRRSLVKRGNVFAGGGPGEIELLRDFRQS
jgi:hypothetical protein